MGSSNVFRQVAKVGLLGAPGLLFNEYSRRKEKQKNEAKEATSKAATQSASAEIARSKAISDASVAAQKNKARKRTIFAGSGTNNIFAPTLGGTSGNKTLG